MEDKHHQNSQPNTESESIPSSSYFSSCWNLGLVAIFSGTFGIFITLALVIKFVPQKTNTDLPKNTPPVIAGSIVARYRLLLDSRLHGNDRLGRVPDGSKKPYNPIIDTANFQDKSNPSQEIISSAQNLGSKPVIRKEAAIVQPISSPPNTTSVTTSVTTSTKPSVATSTNSSTNSSVATSVMPIPPTPLNKGGFNSTSVAPSVVPSVMPIPPTPLNKGGFNSTFVATNQQLLLMVKTALNFTSKHWLTTTTTVTQIKQADKPDEPAKPSEELIPEPTESPILELTSQDAIILSLQNNRDVKNAYLRRILDRQDLEVAEDKFVPDFTPRVEVVYNRNQLGSVARNNGDLTLGADLVVRIPTGGEISANWTGARLTQNTLETSSSDDQNSLGQDVSVRFTQPLLRGFGVDVNRASIEIARLNEKSNILGLKSTLISNITSTLGAYRDLLQAQEALTIQQISLENAQRELEYTEALIEAGRRARIELVNLRADAANRQLSLLASQNRLDQARLNLIAVLDIDKTIQVFATDKPSNEDLELISFDGDVAKEIAFENNIDYLRSLIDIERANIDLLLAKNDKNWDLDFNADYTNNLNNTAENNNDFSASISLSRQFGDRNFEQQVERSQVQLEIAQNTLQEQQENLEIDVINALRDVEFSLQQVEQAKQARELSEQQLENEREKLRLGVGNSRLIEVLRFEEDLVTAKNAELDAQIGYLNSLTSLYSTLGITLDRWDITVEPEI